MCSIDAHKKKNPSEHDYGSGGVGYPIALNSETEALFSLSATINFIVCLLQGTEQNLLERYIIYF